MARGVGYRREDDVAHRRPAKVAVHLMIFLWTLLSLVVLAVADRSNHPCPDKFTNSPVCNLEGQECTSAQGFFAGQVKLIDKVKTPDREADYCCSLCAADENCYYWTWDANSHEPKNYECSLYGNALLCAEYEANWNPFDNSNRPDRISGGSCGPSGTDDPHFVGAHGVHFDFAGEPGADFCLVADRHLHINMRLSGYFDTVDLDGAAASDTIESARVANVTRTWIRALGFRYGSHAIVLEARSDANPELLDGYMSKIEVDGELVKLSPGTERKFADGIRVMQTDVTHFSGYEQDNFVLSIKDVLDVKLRLRSAGARWQRQGDAQTHFDINIRQLSHSDDVHGVLGQTYRPQSRAAKSSYRLVKGFRGEMQVEGPNGDGFLDGSMDDYRTTGLLATDCKFAIFQADGGRSEVTSITKKSSYGVSVMRRRR